ncbi:hypothetical protein ASPNIDRAFT_44167 [Aspergillus niger ATCC 1015]|uniref:Uncharacterized protein n=1 Tax=Aspergillus niger (strain ATCC 1015 / CBS 113.46 / FGSC A1144 / LSHB Ac4 / NCTC 3858a / NRRL 328 / USDA 3528.7) TaxID=380704 RepID=G3Y8Q8_ASPNA|nr:hypothetical protein ASPNIDRAFT_44167 [Aspergillus niger ATCC 1015]
MYDLVRPVQILARGKYLPGPLSSELRDHLSVSLASCAGNGPDDASRWAGAERQTILRPRIQTTDLQGLIYWKVEGKSGGRQAESVSKGICQVPMEQETGSKIETTSTITGGMREKGSDPLRGTLKVREIMMEGRSRGGEPYRAVTGEGHGHSGDAVISPPPREPLSHPSILSLLFLSSTSSASSLCCAPPFTSSHCALGLPRIIDSSRSFPSPPGVCLTPCPLP